MRVILFLSLALLFNLNASPLSFDSTTGFTGNIDMTGYAFGMGVVLGILSVVIVITLVKKLLAPVGRGKWF